MGWKYEQPTGNIYKDDKLIESGYSSLLTNKNNPDHQQVKGLGPSPRGTCEIASHSTSKGPVTIILEQTPEETFGRSGFRIHGEREHGLVGFASEGRIIFSLTTRRLMLRDGGDLEVAR